MTRIIQYNVVNVKLSHSQHNELKLAIKNATEVTLKLISNMIGDFDGKTSFPRKLLLTDRQFSKLPKSLANN